MLEVGMEGDLVPLVKVSGEAGAVAGDILREIRTEKRCWHAIGVEHRDNLVNDLVGGPIDIEGYGQH